MPARSAYWNCLRELPRLELHFGVDAGRAQALRQRQRVGRAALRPSARPARRPSCRRPRRCPASRNWKNSRVRPIEMPTPGSFDLRVVAGEVVVAAARADRADLRVGVERGLVDDAGVVIQAARDRQVERVARSPARPAPAAAAAPRAVRRGPARTAPCRRPSASSLRQRVGVAARTHLRRSPSCAATTSAGQAEALAGQRRAHRVLAALVELVRELDKLDKRGPDAVRATLAGEGFGLAAGRRRSR